MSLLIQLAVDLGATFEHFQGVAERAAEYGYPAVALVVAGDGIFPLLPGETAIVAAAVLASSGDMNIFWVILAGMIGAMAGDWTAYAIGRAGEGPIKRFIARVAGAERLEAAESMVERRGSALVFVGRFLPGLRIAINMACGAGDMRFRRFAAFNALGAVTWSAQASLLGYYAGKAFAEQIWVAFVVAFGITLIVGGAIAISERRRVKAERARKADLAGTPGGEDDADEGAAAGAREAER
ncbi:MAG: rane-associated protein [Miltoncostaeaceae bacterium]|nr:rane-associated protein [Miltoncostaeaceae bacterium]